MTPDCNRSQSGFSLLELLVAFAILAMSMGLIYKSMGTSARNVGDMTHHQQASMLAESLLASRDSVTDQGWNESGEHPPFAWRVSSQPYASEINVQDMVLLHHVNIMISWFDGVRQKQLEVQTLLPQRKPMPGEVVR